MWRNAGDYVKRWGAALIRGAATNAEFTVCVIGCSMCAWTMCHWLQYVRLDYEVVILDGCSMCAGTMCRSLQYVRLEYVSLVAVCAPGL